MLKVFDRSGLPVGTKRGPQGVHITLQLIRLGRVDIHRVARTDPTSWIIAAKLVSVLS